MVAGWCVLIMHVYRGSQNIQNIGRPHRNVGSYVSNAANGTRQSEGGTGMYIDFDCDFFVFIVRVVVHQCFVMIKH